MDRHTAAVNEFNDHGMKPEKARTRRDFLKKLSAIAAGSIVFPALIISCSAEKELEMPEIHREIRFTVFQYPAGL